MHLSDISQHSRNINLLCYLSEDSRCICKLIHEWWQCVFSKPVMFVCLNSKKTESWCHSVCLMAKDSERVKDTQCASSARCSSAVYSLPVFSWGSVPLLLFLCVCLCVFLFILPYFMFSPFLNTIMQSKGPHGTRWCQNDRQKTELKFTKKKGSRDDRVPVISYTLIDWRLFFGGALPENDLLYQCVNLCLHTWIMTTSRLFTEK